MSEEHPAEMRGARTPLATEGRRLIKTAVGGAAGVIHAVDCATTDCQPNENVEALRVLTIVFLCRDSA